MGATVKPQGMKGSKAPTTEKKRSKLGYHRTSVACVHCRRRKIRCEVAPDDPQGRCLDCIKLKKECQYFPVDQQPPMEKKSRQGSKAERSSSILSSPATPTPVPAMTRSDKTGKYSTLNDVHSLSAGAFPAINTGNALNSQMPSYTTDRNVVSADYVTTPPLETPIPWNDYTIQYLAQDPQPLMCLQPNYWSPGSAPVDPISSSPSTLLGQTDSISSTQAPSPSAFSMQPTTSTQAWPVPEISHSTQTMPLGTSTEMHHSPYTTTQFPQHHRQQQQQPQQVIASDPRSSMPSPIQTFQNSPVNINMNLDMNLNMNMGMPISPHPHSPVPLQPFANSPIDIHQRPPPPPPSHQDYQTASPPVRVGQHPPVPYPTWQDMNSMAELNPSVPYPLYNTARAEAPMGPTTPSRGSRGSRSGSSSRRTSGRADPRRH